MLVTSCRPQLFNGLIVLYTKSMQPSRRYALRKPKGVQKGGFIHLIYTVQGVTTWNTHHSFMCDVPLLFTAGASCSKGGYRRYYTGARRYEFYFRVAKQYFTNEHSEWVKYCFCHEKIKFISSSRRVMFFLLYRQKDIDKIIEENYRNYIIDKLTCGIMENKPLWYRM